MSVCHQLDHPRALACSRPPMVIKARRPTHAPACRARSSLKASENAQLVDGLTAKKTEYSDSWLARFLQRFFQEQLAREAGPRSEGAVAGGEATVRAVAGGEATVVFDSMIDSAIEVARLPGAESRDRTLRLLKELFPAWFLIFVRDLFALFPLWFVARHAAVFSVILTYWLVGKSEIEDVDPELLDADIREGWGNTPVGWVPGFALGAKWRPDVGASQGVLVERCRVLETAGCASVCANVCKAPTQNFFSSVGLPLTMVPDYETQSCTLIFGATPPPIQEDQAFTHGCLATCALANGGASQQEAEVSRRLEAWRHQSPLSPQPLSPQSSCAL
jgi:hypothetical protein